MNWLSKLFSNDAGEPVELDHVRAPASANGAARHAAKLAEAARRYGKPFKCAGDGIPREVFKDGRDKVVMGSNVTRLPARDRR
jgi:hypothetical protein